MNRTPGLSIVIFRKELREIFSDRRTLVTAIISPLLITPAFMLLSGSFVKDQQAKQMQATYRIGIANGASSPTMAKFLESAPNLIFVTGSQDDLESQVGKHKLKAAVILSPDADQTLAAGETTDAVIVNDPGNDVSTSAAGRIRAQIKAYAQVINAERLKSANLPKSYLSPIRTTDAATKGSGSALMYLLAMFIPYVLTLSAFTGGMASATDLIAGEKARGTLETLLVSPATRRQIVVGKFCVVAAVCLMSGLLSVVGLTVPIMLHKSSLFLGQSNIGGLTLSATGALLIALAQIPLALLFSGLLVSISSYARNPKEVATLQGPLLMLILIPALGTMFASSEQPITSALIPVLNSTLVIKQVLANAIDPSFIAVAIACSVVYAAIGIALATGIFENEKILLKT